MIKAILIGGPKDGEVKTIDDVTHYKAAVQSRFKPHMYYDEVPSYKCKCRTMTYARVFSLGDTKVFAPLGHTLEMVMASLLENYVDRKED